MFTEMIEKYEKEILTMVEGMDEEAAYQTALNFLTQKGYDSLDASNASKLILM